MKIAMKRTRIQQFLFLVVLIISTTTISAQNVFFSTTSSLYKLDLNTCTKTNLGSVAVSGIMTDIAFHPNGNLYVTSFNSLYTVDTNTLASTYIGNYGFSSNVLSMNALVSDNNGVLYGASSQGNFYTINTSTGQVTLIGALPAASAGDMAFFNGKLYLAATSKRVYEVDIANPSQSILLGTTNAQDFFGFITVGTSCENAVAYGGKTSLYSVDLTTLNTNFICNLGVTMTGMSMASDYLISDCNITVDLDADNSSGSANGNYNAAINCSNTVSISDNDVTINSDADIDSIVIYINNGIVNNGNEILNCSSANNINISNNNTTKLNLVAQTNATLTDFENAIKNIDYLNNASTPSAGLRQVTTVAYANGDSSLAVFSNLNIQFSNADTTNLQKTTCDANLVGTTIQTFTNQFGCDSIVITTSTLIPSSQNPIVTYAITPPTCYNSNNGIISVQPTISGSIYQYAWNDVSLTSNTNTNLSEGTYSVSVTNQLGCEIDTTITLNAPDSMTFNPLISNYNGFEVSCNGGADGNITISVTGGISGYSYNWSNTSSNNTINNLSAGLYYLTVTDMNGCTKVENYTITEPALISKIPTITMATCHGSNTGSIDLAVNGGSGNYSYLWNNMDNTEDISNLLAGIYHVTITDDNGCTEQDNFTITEPAEIQVSASLTQNPCFGSQVGGINLSVTGGTPSSFNGYNYTWNNGGNIEDINNLAAGVYIVTISDSLNCTMSDTFTITAPSTALTTTMSGINNVCFGETQGEATISANGGGSNYTYNWNGLTVNTPTVSNLSAGVYAVSVTDNYGCMVTNSIEIFEPIDIIMSSVITDVLCNGGNSGEITPTAIGGTYPYTHIWNDGDTAFVRENLNAGTYQLNITDLQGCEDSITIQVDEPLPLVLSSIVTNNGCYNGQSGSIDLAVTGGTASYSYLWNNATFNEDLTNVGAGVYHVTVTDAHLCIAYLSDSISEATEIQATVVTSPVTCFGGSNGTAQITLTGGTGIANISWPDGFIGNNRTNLMAGDYIITIADANGCTKQMNVQIQEPNLIAANYNIQTPSCFGFSDGQIIASATGGINSYQYQWASAASGATISNIGIGNYVITITDSNNCVFSDTVIIQQPNSIGTIVQIVPPVCSGDSTGNITQSIIGGTAPYNYNWTNGSTSLNLNNIVSGSYTFNIVDANGCATSETYVVAPPNPIVLTAITQNQICNSLTGDIQTNITGGVAPYQINWNTGDTVNGLHNLAANQYSVTVTDNLGCSVIDNFNIISTNPMIVQPIVNNVRCYGETNGSIQLMVSNAQNPVFTWSTGASTSQITSLSTGTYTVNITDDNGCTYLFDTTITQPSDLNLSFANITHACNGLGGLSSNAGGGTLPYSYTWNNTSQTTSTINNLNAGSYQVTVTDANGCTISNQTPIEVYTSPVANFSYTKNGLTIALQDVSQFGQFWEWNLGDGTVSSNPTYTSHTYSSMGSYDVQLTITNPCGQDVKIIQDVLNITSGLDDIVNSYKLKIVPNPNNGQFRLEVEDLPIGDWNMEIYSITGQLMQMERRSIYQANTQIPISLRDVSDGLYLLRMVNDDGVVITRKFIVGR